MKTNFSRRTVAGLFALCLSACAHNSAAPTTAAHGANAGSQAAPAADVNAALAPDVLATCQRASTETVAGHFAEAVRLTNACLASPNLPVPMRVFALQRLTLLDMTLHDERSALDAQLAAIELTSEPKDLQLLLLAHLYEINQRGEESLATLERIRTRHDAAHDLDWQVGGPYYLQRGATLALLGRNQDAIAALNRAVELQPASADAYYRRAQVREASGDAAGARVDYTQFARWALDLAIDAPKRAKLTSLGIDPAVERRHPFGSANPLRDLAVQSLDKGREALKTASTPQAKAAAYSDIAAFSDNLDHHTDALAAIDKAIALAPDDIDYPQSKVTTLVALNRLDVALALAAPLRQQARDKAAVAAKPSAVYAAYSEVYSSVAEAYMQQGKWAEAIDALTDNAKGADQSDQDYMATLYLYVRAKSAGAAPASKFFDDYIQRNAQPAFGNYRRWLLLYMQGRATPDQVYVQLTVLPSPLAIQNGLAEIWFMAAAYQRYVKHDNSAADAYVKRLNDLQPYGTHEWSMAQRGGA